MKHFILFFALVASSYAQFTSTELPSQIVGVPGPRWQGPFANHILGQPVGDTPEVAEAKAAHYKAHARILEILPVLPQEEYQTVNVVEAQPQQQTFVQPQVSFVPQPTSYVAQQPSYVVQQAKVPEVQVTTPAPVVKETAPISPKFIQYAEEIPRSELGELPEVAAARKAHLAAYEEIKKLLPKLVETPTVVPGVQQPVVRQQVVSQPAQVANQQPQIPYQVTQQAQVVPQVPQVVYQQPQSAAQQPQENQVTYVNHQAESAAYKQQLQRNLEWFYNPQQFYTYVPQDTPEVAAAKIEHLKLLQSLI
ncbi:RNA polymerase II degradation factor 1-like [Coccinella septempunctata]|uniref:RNA polymerase II degradation factor 1-like n=1 Tax=Coccinella septempunctata TaxID=41139 RepID=UPI001D065E6B|nr:RNA polymerase II degradation factor 1-like [Coccinella septempunctata]